MTMNKTEQARFVAQYKAYAAAKPANAAPSITYSNSTTKGLYTGNRMASPRENAGQISDNGRGV